MAEVLFSPSGLDPSDAQNAPSNDRTNTPEYTPTADEQKLLKKLNGMFLQAKKAREKVDNKWVDRYRFFRGKQWSETRPTFRHAEVINQIFKIIESTVPIMTDSKPRFEMLPQEPSDIQIAEILNQLADWDWTRGNWSYQLTELLFDSHIYGTGISSLKFDQSADDGLGKIEYDISDPFYCYPCKRALDTNRKCSEFFYAEILDIQEIKKRYPEKGKYVKGNGTNEAVLSRESADVSPYARLISPTDGYVYTNENPKNYAQNKETVLFECFWYPDDFEEKEKVEVDDNGQPTKTYQQIKKYPNGRYTVWADDIILIDKANPLETGIIPYQRIVNYVDPRQFWGISELENLEGPQQVFNKVLSFALDVLVLMGNPVWIVDANSGVDVENIYNRPGEIITKNVGSEVRRETGVQLQPYILEIIEKMKMWMDEVSGANDITRGVRPDGVSAALAIQELQQAAQTRIRQKSRFLDNYLQTFGQHYLDLVFQYYTIPQVVRVTNKQDPTLQNYFKFHVENIDDEMTGESKKVIRITPYNRNDVGEYKEGEEKIMALNKKFDVKVTTGSSLPFSKVEKEQRLFNLYDRKIIDAEQVLKDMEYPNYQAILSRMMEAQAAQAAAEQQGGGGNGNLQAPDMMGASDGGMESNEEMPTL